MMMHTKNIYVDYVKNRTQPEKAFQGSYPEWPLMDAISDSWMIRILFGIGYFVVYLYIAPHWLFFLLLPIHFFMGPIHGAIVNWCGHKYGYSNFNNDDHSKNSIPVDVFLMGELMQNNHHKSPNNINFAKKWWEFDPTYPIIRFLHLIRIIKIRKIAS